MKRILFTLAAIVSTITLSAQKQTITKTGLSFGPLPEVAFDADKGMQLGLNLNIYDFGNGSNYPNYDSKWFIEAAYFTKGSQLYTLAYDNKVLIPGVRWSSAVSASIDKAMDFYGFNGYQSIYDPDNFKAPFYRLSRTQVIAKSDLIGKIGRNLSWELGYHAALADISTIDYDSINKGKEESEIFPKGMPTLFDLYKSWGLISAQEAEGGITSSIRAGLVYDSRDKEGAPTKGIWAEGHVIVAPESLGSTIGYTRYSATFRHYLPIVSNNVLTFAYRLNYEGTIGDNAPFYALPFITVMGENFDKDGMGGYRTVRGMMRDRVIGLDMATYTAELRWRFAQFSLFNQNIALGLSAFSDGSMVTRGRKTSVDMKDITDLQGLVNYPIYYKKVFNNVNDSMHITYGGGFRFIMNENFIIAAEYGMPLNKQDGAKGAFYINTGYLF